MVQGKDIVMQTGPTASLQSPNQRVLPPGFQTSSTHTQPFAVKSVGRQPNIAVDGAHIEKLKMAMTGQSFMPHGDNCTETSQNGKTSLDHKKSPEMKLKIPSLKIN